MRTLIFKTNPGTGHLSLQPLNCPPGLFGNLAIHEVPEEVAAVEVLLLLNQVFFRGTQECNYRDLVPGKVIRSIPLEREYRIAWTLAQGGQAVVTVKLIESVEATPRIYLDAEVGGSCVGSWEGAIKERAGIKDGCVALIGKLGIRATELAKINAAVAALKETPVWQAHLRREAKAVSVRADYAEHRKIMARAMRE